MLDKFFQVVIVFVITPIVILACSSGGNTSSTSTTNGQLSFTPNTNIQITQGSIRTVIFSIKNSSGLVNQKVNFSTTDPTVAVIAPASCSISSSSNDSLNSSCQLTVTGLKNGNVSLIAQSNGYPALVAPAQVSNQVQYDSLAIEGESNNSYTAYYPAMESAPHKIIITAVLLNSSGITNSNALYAYFESSGSNLVFEPQDTQQCQLTTENPSCQLVATLTNNQNLNTSLQPVGSILSNYESVGISIIGTESVQAGVIKVSSQNSSNTIYTGMHAPLFVNWSGFNGFSGSIDVTLTTITPSNLRFYDYESGQYLLTNSKVCRLTPSSTSCGFGLDSLSIGNAKIQVSVTQTNGLIPEYESNLNIAIETPSTTGRTITFTNNTQSLIMLGVTSGAATSYIGPNTPSANVVSASTHDLPPGAGSFCGPSNPGAACPIGATCAQGGANPESTTPYFCFWDKSIPQNGSYQIQPSSSSSIFISSSSGITSGSQQIQWSGNYHLMACQDNQCPAPESGFGTGPSYQAVTLAEVTYQHNTVDYYDVSIINGANFAFEFGPNNTTVDPSNAYYCGKAGSFSPQSGGWSTSNPTQSGLPASTWILMPSESSIPESGFSGSAFSYFAVVNPITPVENCNTTCHNGGVCGWDYTKVTSGSYTFESSERVCGSFVSFATADQIYGWNSTASNLSPFNLSLESSVTPSYLGVSAISVGNLQLCNNNTYSAYGQQPINPADNTPASLTMSCGGVNWNQLGITRPSQPAVTVNQFWMQQVLPTVTWLKQACPTCYTFPYDDMASTFTCMNNTGINSTNYSISIYGLKAQ